LIDKFGGSSVTSNRVFDDHAQLTVLRGDERFTLRIRAEHGLAQSIDWG
jgi:hypothetical protein